jgi:hypothetical protein
MMHIACGADDKYAPHAAAMFRSLERVSPKGSLHIHFLCDQSLTPPVRDKLARYAARLKIHRDFLEVGEAEAAGLPTRACPGCAGTACY